MKNIKRKLCVALFFVVFSILGLNVQSYASLSSQYINADYGNIVYDTDNEGQIWMADLSLFTNMTYTQQLDAIEQLNKIRFNGFNDWHMATRNEMETLWIYDELAITNAFGPSKAGPTYTYYSGRYDEVSWESQHSTGTIIVGYDGKSELGWYSADDDNTYPYNGAWITSNSLTTVPTPPTILLLGSVLAGLVGFRRKVKQS